MESFREVAANLVSAVDFVRWGASRFRDAGLHFGHGTDNAVDEALALVLHGLHLPHGLPDSILAGRLLPGEKRTLYDLIWRRVHERIPVAYITGEAFFAGLSFEVSRDVLVPRSPMAELIERDLAPWADPGAVGHVLDLCAGSGCIGIALAARLPWVQVDLGDISAKALAVAARNVERHAMQERINIVQSDLFAALGDRVYDVILTNPPYVGSGEMAGLPPEYRHEPRLGLETGREGLEIPLRILASAGDYLSEHGVLFLEVGYGWPRLEDALPGVPLTWVELERGGEGILVMQAAELLEHRAAFQQALEER